MATDAAFTDLAVASAIDDTDLLALAQDLAGTPINRSATIAQIRTKVNPFANQQVFIPTLGQTVFTLSQTISGALAFGLFLNGILTESGVDYTVSGTTLIWLDAGGVTLKTTDKLIAWYDFTAPPLNAAIFEANSLGVGQANVTGNSETHTMIFETELKDIGSNYDPITGIFTAPVTASYHFDVTVALDDLTVAMTAINLYFAATSESTRILQLNPSSILNTARVIFNGGITTSLDAADTMKVIAQVGGGPTQVDVDTTFISKFSGYFVGA